MDSIVDVNTLFGPLPVASTDLAVDALVTLMQKHSVGAACTLSTLGLLLDPQVGNSATRAACEENPHLLPVATLNPTMYFGDTAPLLRLKQEGFRMVRFFPEEQDWPLDYAPFTAMLRCLDEAALPIMVDVRRRGSISTVLRAIESYPAPVILAGVTADTLSEAITALRHHESWFVETSRLLAPGAIKFVVDTVGPQRLLFGSSAPSRPIAGSLNVLRFAGLADDARALVLAGNARRLLHLAA